MSDCPLDELMQHRDCCSCGYPISFGPVAKSSEGYKCGRCSSENACEESMLYEALAMSIDNLYACKYKNSGCDVLLPFGKPMQIHEASCAHTLYKCPLAPRQECDWEGTFSALEEHFRAAHSSLVLENLKVELDFEEKTEVRYIYFYMNTELFFVDLSFAKDKGLSVELLRVLKDEKVKLAIKQRYITTLSFEENSRFRPFQEGNRKFGFSRIVGKYFLNKNRAKTANNNVINTTFLSNTATEKVIISVVLDPPTTSVITKRKTKKRIFACKNRKFGCKYINCFGKVKQHVKTCCVYGCPLGEDVCDWRGIMDRIPKHVIKRHKHLPEDLAETANMSPPIELNEILSHGRSASFWVTMTVDSLALREVYNCFRVCIKVENVDTPDAAVCIAVQYVGDACKAKEHTFDVHLKEPGGKSRTEVELSCTPLTVEKDAFKHSTRIFLEHPKETTLTLCIDQRESIESHM